MMFSNSRGEAPAAAPAAQSKPDLLITVPGTAVHAALGEPISAIRLAAVRNGRLSPIPFQIDERDAFGRYVVPALDPRPDFRRTDDGILDQNDELVFMSSDAGPRSASFGLRGGAHLLLEIQIVDPLDEVSGYVYLSAHKNPPPLSPLDYVRAGRAPDEVLSGRYNVAYGELPTILSVLRARTNGEFGPDLLDRQKERMHIKFTPFLLGLSYKRHEEDARAALLGLKDGPVRVIRTTSSTTPLMLGLATQEEVRTALYDRAGFESRVPVGVRLDMSRVIRKNRMKVGIDFGRSARGMQVFTAGGGGPFLLDGKMDDAEKKFKSESDSWALLSGEQGTVFIRLTLDQVAKREIRFKDSGRGDGPEEEKGYSGLEIEIDLNSFLGQKRVFRLVYRFPEEGSFETGERLVERLDHPVSVRVVRASGTGMPSERLTGDVALRSRPLARSYKERTLDRELDAVVISGYSLREFFGVQTDHLGLFAAHSGRLEPIPFQIDEKDGQGRFVLPEGESPTADSDGGRLDDNDEIAFMAADLGDRVDVASWPFGLQRAMEIAVRDPEGGEEGWAYLAGFEASPTRSLVDYVSGNFPEMHIQAKSYTVKFPKDRIYFNHFTLNRDGVSHPENLVDRLENRFHLTFKFLWIPLPFNTDEEKFRMKTIAYKDGPIRVIGRQRIHARMSFGSLFYLPDSDWQFFGNQTRTENKIENPFAYTEKALKRVSKANLRLSTDMRKSAKGMKFYNSRNPNGVVIDGKMSEEEKNLDLSTDRWAVLTGEQGSIFVRIKFGEGLTPERKLYYIDDKNKAEWNEEERGQYGHTGYEIDLKSDENNQLLTRPSYIFWLIFFFPSNFEPGDEIGLLRVVDRPLEVQSRSMTPP